MRHNFRELHVWQLGMEVVEDIYSITKEFPKEELFGLSLQMRKAAVSIPSNLAEGCGRGTKPQLIHFANNSQGSAFELETQALLTKRLHFCQWDRIDPVVEKIIRVQKMIDGFQFSLNR